jgi:hypothetical protein
MKQLSKVLLLIGTLTIKMSFGQQSPQPYGYNFGTVAPTPSTCNNSCAGSFFVGVPSDAGEFLADSDNGAVSASPRGSLFSYVTDNSSVINGNNQLSFMFRAAESPTAGNRFVIDKFGKYGSATNQSYEGPTAMMAFKFKMDNDNLTTTSKDGDIVFVLGKSSPTFSTGGVPTLSLSNNNTFLALKVTMTDGILSTSVYSLGSWVSQPLNIPLNQTNIIEIYANNSSTTRDAGGYTTMSSGTWYVRLNGVGQAINSIGNLTRDENLNSLMILGFNSPNNSFYMYMDDIRYSTSSSTAAALPVSLKSFTISSKSSYNQLSWITASEMNNKGFEVKRSVGSANEFKTIGFVGTRAKDGNSQSEISYSFEDADVKSGQTYNYRLNQIDFDGKSTLSPIRSIKTGSIESNLNVYPNPSQGSITVNTGSTNGKLNIYVLDNTGRTVNQYLNVSTSNTRISNLKRGLYTLKIVNTETGEQSAQRVVVQ